MKGSKPEEAVLHTVATLIHEVRGQRVMLDGDLAVLYGVSTGALNQAVRRNAVRFPADFAFVVAGKELRNLKSQIVISSSWGGRRKRPMAFTEQGIAMLSSVLRSERAAQVNVAIMRAFVALRRMLPDYQELARRVGALEHGFGRHDGEIATLFDAIRRMLQPPEPGGRIGFGPE
jgi:hypothetical protein